jgi:putative PIN family toxin of toxin-antitoxin system
VLRVVADTNVLVSAVLNAEGPPFKVVRAAFQQRLTLIVSAQLLDELVGVLARPKIARIVPPERSQLFVEAVEGVGVAVGNPAEAPAIVRDRRDDYLVALALAAHADRLVTGDADLLELMGTGVVICTPRALLNDLEVT